MTQYFVALGLILTLAVALPTQEARAASPRDRSPQVLLEGLDLLRDADLPSALRHWTVSSNAAGRAKVLSAQSSLEALMAPLGAATGAEVVGYDDLVPTVHIAYVRLDHEQGSFYARFAIRSHEDAWSISMIQASDRIGEIVPPNVLERGEPYWVPPVHDDE